MKSLIIVAALAGLGATAPLSAQGRIPVNRTNRQDCSYNQTGSTVGDIVFGRNSTNTNTCRNSGNRSNGSWYQVGQDRNGTIYERRVTDGNGNVIVQRARRDSFGNMSIISSRNVGNNNGTFSNNRRRGDDNGTFSNNRRRGDNDGDDDDQGYNGRRASRNNGRFNNGSFNRNSGNGNSERHDRGRGKGHKGRD
jgi:hypothetical protein